MAEQKLSMPLTTADMLQTRGISGLLATPGNSGCQIWQQQDGDITHIIVISWSDGYESIKAFAGEDIINARYYREDKKYLLEMEPALSPMNVMISGHRIPTYNICCYLHGGFHSYFLSDQQPLK